MFGVEKARQAQGRSPLDYGSKFTLELAGNETAREAMVKVYQALLDTITRNIPRVLADHDPEFLHGIRIAIRRTRTGLSLVKRVLPDSVTDRFRLEFSRLGALTGPVRDLDVYLLAHEDHLKQLPPFLQPGLQDYFVKLRHKRQAEQEKLACALRAKKTQNIFTAWQCTLKQHEHQPADLANLPVRELADRVILKRYKQIVRSDRILDSSTPDAQVHRLRIQCKKLRYSIEFFASLYPKQKLRTLVRQLKKLQEHLGRFNDLSVQQEMLRQSLSNLSPDSRHSLELAAALGGLLKDLFQKQQNLRTHFAKAFARFGDQKTAALFHEFFRKR
jgi:CHAD domain-containing protein